MNTAFVPSTCTSISAHRKLTASNVQAQIFWCKRRGATGTSWLIMPDAQVGCVVFTSTS